MLPCYGMKKSACIFKSSTESGMKSRPNHLLISIAVVFALFATLKIRAQNPQTLDGIWKSEGYGLLLEIKGNRIDAFEITSLSCLASWTAVRENSQTAGTEPTERVWFKRQSEFLSADYRTSGHLPQEPPIIFSGGPVMMRIKPGASADVKLLHMDDSVSDIVIRRLKERPQVCSRQSRDSSFDTPLVNYEIFRQTFAEHYPFFALHHVNWAAVDRRFRPQVKPNTTPKELLRIFREMIEPLHDAHTSISASTINDVFEGERPDSSTLTDADLRNAIKVIETKYVRDGLHSFCNGSLEFGLLDGSIGYLAIRSFYNFTDGDEFWSGSRALTQTLDAIFADADQWKGLVIDVRENPGGNDPYANDIAARLTNEKYLAYAKVARIDPGNAGRFSRPQKVHIIPAANKPHFFGPIVLLINQRSNSAAEGFAMALMERRPKVVRVGQSTQGVFSDVLFRHLPNGWEFGLPNEIYYTRRGRAFDGTGVPPDIKVSAMTRTDVKAGCDPALDKAIQLLHRRKR